MCRASLTPSVGTDGAPEFFDSTLGKARKSKSTSCPALPLFVRSDTFILTAIRSSRAPQYLSTGASQNVSLTCRSGIQVTSAISPSFSQGYQQVDIKVRVRVPVWRRRPAR